MNGATLIGRLRLEGVDMCNENWLRQDEEGMHITISVYPDGQPELEREKWIIRSGGVAKWADENPKWFEIVCGGGLQMTLGQELMETDIHEDKTYRENWDKMFDEFVSVATDRGLWFRGMGIMFVPVSSPEPEPEVDKKDTRPLWRRILRLA